MGVSFNSSPGEVLDLRQEVYFDSYRYGETSDDIPGQIKIMRGSDGLFWDGADWSATEAFLDTSFTSGNEYHSYVWTVPAAPTETYNIRIRVNNDRATETLMTVFVRPASVDGGGGTSSTPKFDAIDFVTGIPFR